MIETNGGIVVPTLQARYRLAYVEGSHKVVIAWSDGSARAVVGRIRGDICPLAWSPDGAFLYFRSEDGITRYGTESGTSELVVPISSAYRVLWHLECSPDGREISFFRVRHERPGEPNALCTANVDGSESRVVRSDIAFGAVVDWKRGRALIERRMDKERTRLELTDLASGELVAEAVVQSRGHFLFGRLSPTGDSVLYSTGSSGVNVVSLVNGDIINLASHGGSHSWSPDGHSIAYAANNCEAWVASPSRGTARLVARFSGHDPECPKKWYRTPAAWSPDGRVLCVNLTRLVRRPVGDPDGVRVKTTRFVGRLVDAEGHERLVPPRVDVDFDPWKTEHAATIIDLDRNEVSAEPTFWGHAVFAPVV